VFDHIKLAHIT